MFNPSTTNYLFLGVLITGGYPTYQLKTTELFVPATGKICQLKDLPDYRTGHTLNNLVVCGSVHEPPNTCVQFESTFPHGSWTEYGTTEVWRVDAVGFNYEGKILLLGGADSENTAEIVGEGVKFNTTSVR